MKHNYPFSPSLRETSLTTPSWEIKPCLPVAAIPQQRSSKLANRRQVSSGFIKSLPTSYTNFRKVSSSCSSPEQSKGWIIKATITIFLVFSLVCWHYSERIPCIPYFRWERQGSGRGHDHTGYQSSHHWNGNSCCCFPGSLHLAGPPRVQDLQETILMKTVTLHGLKGCGLKASSAFIPQWALSLAPADKFSKDLCTRESWGSLKKKGLLCLWTMVNYSNICIFLFAQAAGKFRNKFTVILQSLWLLILHVLNTFLFLPHWPPVWIALFLVLKVNLRFFCYSWVLLTAFQKKMK